ncbi:MAG: LamG-like jellyroll fold domain-containing protein [Candidatus Paceibacterota bacterium]
MQRINKAFTLIELLVVIAIIGILSALIVIGMSSTTQKASVAKAQVFANSLRNSLLADMVSEWKLDDGTGNSTTKDSWASVYANTGTLGTAAVGDASEPTWLSTGCVSGNCLDFDGADDYVDFGSNASLSMGTKDHIASFWVKFDNAVAGAQPETLIVCGSVTGGATGDDGYWIVRYQGTSKIRGYFSDGSAAYIGGDLSANSVFVANTWYNIVTTFDRDGVVQAYVNGLKQTGYSINIAPQQGDVQNYMNLRIGAYSATGHRLDGQMDEVRIFHAITTLSQIKQNYYAGLNKLFAKNSLNRVEYEYRMAELQTSSLANK